eukprot:gene19951-26659_t
MQRWCFDVELLFLLQLFNVPVAEEHVHWTEMPGSKIRFTSILHMAFELLTIKLYGRTALLCSVTTLLCPALQPHVQNILSVTHAAQLCVMAFIKTPSPSSGNTPMPPGNRSLSPSPLGSTPVPPGDRSLSPSPLGSAPMPPNNRSLLLSPQGSKSMPRANRTLSTLFWGSKSMTRFSVTLWSGCNDSDLDQRLHKKMNPSPREKLPKSPLQMLDQEKCPLSLPMPTLVIGMNSGTTIDGRKFNLEANPNDSATGTEQGDHQTSREERIREAIRIIELAPTRGHVHTKRPVPTRIGPEGFNSRALTPTRPMRSVSFRCTDTSYDAQPLSSRRSNSMSRTRDSSLGRALSPQSSYCMASPVTALGSDRGSPFPPQTSGSLGSPTRRGRSYMEIPFSKEVLVPPACRGTSSPTICLSQATSLSQAASLNLVTSADTSFGAQPHSPTRSFSVSRMRDSSLGSPLSPRSPCCMASPFTAQGSDRGSPFSSSTSGSLGSPARHGISYTEIPFDSVIPQEIAYASSKILVSLNSDDLAQALSFENQGCSPGGIRKRDDSAPPGSVSEETTVNSALPLTTHQRSKQSSSSPMADRRSSGDRAPSRSSVGVSPSSSPSQKQAPLRPGTRAGRFDKVNTALSSDKEGVAKRPAATKRKETFVNVLRITLGRPPAGAPWGPPAIDLMLMMLDH